MELNQKMIVIIADGAAIQSMKTVSSITLADLRKKVNANHYIKNKLTYSLLFVSDGKLIDSGQEPQTKLKDILVADQYEVHLNSKLNSINIVINQKDKHTKSVPLAFSLSSLRNLDPKLFPLHLNFFKNDKIIRLTDESRIKISDILVNNTIYIQKADSEKHTAFEADKEEQLQQDQPKQIKEKGKLEIQQKVEIMKFNILIDIQKQINTEFDVNKTLRSLRESTKEIAASMDFSWKNGPIYEEDELEIKISDILDEPIQKEKSEKPKRYYQCSINVLWIAEKYEKLKNDPEFKKNQIEFQETGNISKYLNLKSTDINVLPKGCILDPDGNPADSSYDLGIDGMFTKFKILIGVFYLPIAADLRQTAMLALQGKGFTVEQVQTELEFTQRLPDYDQGWIISTNSSQLNTNEFTSAIQKHLAKKKGLLIWADNEPYLQQANTALTALNLKVPIQLTGNDYGTMMLERLEAPKATQRSFIQHQITTGIFKMNEGVTICYPVNQQNPLKIEYGELEVIGVGSAGKPSYMCLEGTESRGRIIIDCGFTKLMPGWWNGNWRYVRNCAVWLLWLEHQL